MDRITRILLAEDHHTVREGIKLLVNAQPDMEVVGEAGNGRQAIDLAKSLVPDLVLMDVAMPEMNGLRTTLALKRLMPDVKILSLTRHTDEGYLQELIKAGVNGYVLKQSAPNELIHAIRAVSSGGSYVDASLTEKLMGGYSSRSVPLRGESTDITSRETEILKYIAWGYSNKAIAEKLSISVKTVETHKSSMMRKLGMTSRIDIVRFALLKGWLEDN